MPNVLLNEAAETDQWLQDYLTADSTLSGLVTGVFSTFVGYGRDPLPLVRFFLIGQEDLMVLNANRVWSELRYQVEAIDEGRDSTRVRAIARRVDELLHRHQGDSLNPAVFIQEVWREAALFRRESEAGSEYLFAGGEYVVRTSALA